MRIVAHRGVCLTVSGVSGGSVFWIRSWVLDSWFGFLIRDLGFGFAPGVLHSSFWVLDSPIWDLHAQCRALGKVARREILAKVRLHSGTGKKRKRDPHPLVVLRVCFQASDMSMCRIGQKKAKRIHCYEMNSWKSLLFRFYTLVVLRACFEGSEMALGRMWPKRLKWCSFVNKIREQKLGLIFWVFCLLVTRRLR